DERDGPEAGGKCRSHPEKTRSPERGDEHRDGEADAPEDGARPKPPEIHRASSHQRGDRRRERDRVVGMDDPRHVAEHTRGHEEPAAPEEISGARAIGALRAGMYHEARDQCDDRKRYEPRDLTDALAGEEAARPGSRARRGAVGTSRGPRRATPARTQAGPGTPAGIW